MGGEGEGRRRTEKNDLKNRQYVNRGDLGTGLQEVYNNFCVCTFLNFPNIYNEHVLLI